MIKERSEPDLGGVSSEVVDVLAPVAVDTAYSYRAPSGVKLEPGAFVRMPLGARMATGVVWSARSGGGDNLKPIAEALDWPPLRPALRDFIDWTARWTLAPRGMLLRMAIRAGEIAEPPAPKFGLVATGKAPTRMTDARARVLAALAESGAATPKAVLAARAACSTGVIDGLVADGALAAVALAPERGAAPLDPDFRLTRLNADQRAAADDLIRLVAERAFSATLLEGVTGSGKTEVYFEAVAEALRQRRQALVLLPEIALTAQFLDRFVARFGARPAEWHSGLTERQRERVWTATTSGEAQVVVGARSALFLPFADLGLVVVDEEHEGAYKQEEGVIYNARDMAVVRARFEKAPIVLASATPAIETRFNAESGRYRWLQLPSRFGPARLPDIALVDLKREGPPRGRWLSPRAIAWVEEARGRGEQAMLFLNRRGYAPLTLCRNCGHRFECPNCSTWLVEHRFRASLVCHHCGHVESRPATLPAMPRGRHADRLRTGRRASGRGGGSPLSRHSHIGSVVRYARRDRDFARSARCSGARRLRPHHRHAAGRQGAQLSASDLRLRRRRRRRPRQRRSARGRADVPAPPPGDRTRGTRDKPGHALVADLAAGASGHRGAYVRRRRAVLP